MTLRSIISRLIATVRTRRRDAELSDEIRVHLEALTEDYVRRGMSLADARAAARREFGGVEQIKESYRDQRGWPFLDGLGQDLRYAVRTLRKNRGFTIVAVLTLALGIGANTAIFSVLNAVMLRSLPVSHPEELMVATYQTPRDTVQRFSFPLFDRLRRAVPSAGQLTAVSRVARMFGMADGDREAETTSVQLVSGEYFSLLGVSSQLGRTLTGEDNRTLGGHPVAVVSDRFWHQHLGTAPDVVGRGLTLNGAHFTIVGVGPRQFAGVWLEAPTDVWIPLVMQAEVHYAQNYSSHNAEDDKDRPWVPQEGIEWLQIIGRAGPQTRTQIASQLRPPFQQDLERRVGSWGIKDAETRRAILQQQLTFEPFDQGFSNFRRQFGAPLRALLGATGLILLLTCANVANLMLARAAARRREIAVRLSIGATRARVIRQLLAEGLLLVTLATIAGLAFAKWTGDVLVRAAIGVGSGTTPFSASLDLRVFGFTVAVSVLTGLLFALAPAFSATRLNLGSALKASATRVHGGSRLNAAKLLVAMQVGLSLILVVGAALFVRSLGNLGQAEVGFEREHILSVWINPHAAGYQAERLANLYRDLITRVEAVPGVESATVAMCGLLSGCNSSSSIQIAGYQMRPGERMNVQENRVGPKYFSTVGMQLLQGRDFPAFLPTNAPKVAIVNESMVRRFFPNQPPIGQRFGYGPPDTEIIGVVRDARVNTVQQEPAPMVYYPIGQGSAKLVVDAGSLDIRAIGDPRSIASAVRQAVTEVDRGLPIDRVTTTSRQVELNLTQERLIAGLTFAFGLLGLTIAGCGLFGLMSYNVGRRTSELGLRLALGARPGRLLWSVMRESLVLVLLGLAAGIPAVFALSRLISGLLVGISAQDPATIAGACAVLITVACAAGFLPAWRASRVDPMVALRHE
jgi:predicted permease